MLSARNQNGGSSDMAKFFGVVGYAKTVVVRPGVTKLRVAEKPYYGDVYKNTGMYQSSGNVHDDLNVSNTISIVADPFAYQNFHLMRYVEYMGAKWKIKNVEVQYPRLILTIGGVWNDSDGETS
jgi:hypothetical protein